MATDHSLSADADGFALREQFWASFHETHWEKKGAVIARPFAAPIATPAESFACLVAASDRFRAGDRSVRLEFCIEHAQVLAEVGRFLPVHSDADAAGYAKRVTRLIDGRRFGLVVEDVQAYDATLWLRLRECLHGLFVHTGLPGDGCKATVFLGNYDSTPFGLHRGSSANFMFVVDGQKRMRFWPDEFFHGKEDLTHKLEYTHYNDDSIVMDAAPGDIIFWPADYWHIGESVDGGLSSAVSVALFMDARPVAELISHLPGLVSRNMSSGFAPTIEQRAARMTEALRAAAADPTLERALRIEMLNRETAFGFARPPLPLAHRSLNDGEIVRGHAEYPIQWMRDEDDEIVCSANGHGFTVAASPHILALLEALNSGQEHDVAGLIGRHSGVAEAGGVEFETSPESVRSLLEKLLSLRAID